MSIPQNQLEEIYQHASTLWEITYDAVVNEYEVLNLFTIEEVPNEEDTYSIVHQTRQDFVIQIVSGGD